MTKAPLPFAIALIVGVLAGLAGGRALAENLAENIVLEAAQDNTLYEDPVGDISNGAGEYLFMGRTSAGELRRSVVRFDLAAVPSFAIVDAAAVRFQINLSPSGGGFADDASLHRLEAAWGEGSSDAGPPGGQGGAAAAGDATWQYRFYPTEPWQLAGGDFDSAPSSTAFFGNFAPETISFDSTPALVADVQSWLRNPASNHGWVLLGDELRDRNARRMASRENLIEAGPSLEVDFHAPFALTPLSNQLDRPIGLAHAGDGSGRLFIVQQDGIIRIYDAASATLLATPFLDISATVFSVADGGGQSNEQGLLGLAFHPDYASNGRFFVNYTISPSANVWHTVVAEFQVSGDPNEAMSIGETILEFPQEARNHNGGDMHFGPDGYLYIASGDGGGANDTYQNAQNLDTLRGALLRIDVDGSPPQGAELCGLVSNYGIPPGNPFTGANDGCDEILHYGLRNPWRFSFDAKTGDLWIADVGQSAWEEINRVPGDAAGLNFGWPCREGMHDFPTSQSCDGPLTEPILEYSHAGGNCSITGGYLSRGSRLGVEGHYFFGDWCTRRVWLASQGSGGWISEEWTGTASVLSSLSSFGQDEQCGLYALDRAGGALYRIDDSEHLFGGSFETRLCR